MPGHTHGIPIQNETERVASNTDNKYKQLSVPH